MGKGGLDIDYYPIGRGPSFALLLLALFALSSSVSILANFIGRPQTHGEIRAKPAPGPDKTSQIDAQRDTHELKFDRDERWLGWNSNVTDNWHHLLPSNNGLGQDDNFNDGVPFGIAMFHQIHCLQQIRAHYTTLLNVPGTTEDDIEFVKTKSQMGHIAHCFDWLRQVLLCHADDTREIQVRAAGGGLVDNTTRVCRNSDVLYDATKNAKAVHANIP